MAVDLEQVKAALHPEEPDYAKSAKQLGAAALPHLEAIIGGSETLLAAKAAYLAGLIGGAESAPAVAKAARSSQPTVRIAAAAAAAHLPAEHSDSVLLQLVDDADRGVQKVAVRSAPAAMSEALRSRVSAMQEQLTRAAAAEAKKAPKPAKKAKKARPRK
jgi:HEAT repeat protein